MRGRAKRWMVVLLVTALMPLSCTVRKERGPLTGRSAASLRAQPTSAKAELVEGLVEIQDSIGAEWRALRVGDTLPPGASVRTSASGIVQLLFEANGSRVRLANNTQARFTKMVLRDPGVPGAIDVIVDVLHGQVTGSFRSTEQPSIFQVIPPSGNAMVYRPNPGETLSVGLSIQPTMPAAGLFGTLTPDRIFSGGASGYYLALAGGQYAPGTVIPEPSTGALVLAGIGLMALRARGARRGRS